ncbi:hypothetical protein ACFWNK_14380 [Streptomyces sp. NPDC058417]|uniref:hypothetical protein n=1 Tax=unclassified Streptomyces TaxID=2593676 RepID=UPI00365A4DB3
MDGTRDRASGASGPGGGAGEGCLVGAARLVLRGVVVVVVVPVRMVWDALVVVGRSVGAWVLRPLGRALLWLLRVLVAVPLELLWRYVVVPLARVLGWLLRYLVLVPARWLYAYVLAPLGRGLAWLLAPVGRVLLVVLAEVADALGYGWRIAGRVSRAVGRLLGTLFRWTVADPARWVHRTVLTPVGHVLRDLVLRPVGRIARRALDTAREAVRQARSDVRRALSGAPGRRTDPPPGEPSELGTRTLDGSTTALTKD